MACVGSDLRDAGPGEGHDDGHHVDGELELQELGDAVVDVPPPHDGLDDAGEVVVGQDDVRRLLRHVCAGDALTGEKAEGHDGIPCLRSQMKNPFSSKGLRFQQALFVKCS